MIKASTDSFCLQAEGLLMTLLEIFHFETLLESKEVQNDPLYLAALDVGCPPQNRMRFACVRLVFPSWRWRHCTSCRTSSIFKHQELGVAGPGGSRCPSGSFSEKSLLAIEEEHTAS